MRPAALYNLGHARFDDGAELLKKGPDAQKTAARGQAALALGVLTHNLVVLFERKLGWLQAVTIGSLRYWLFVTAGVISHPQGRTTVKLAVPMRERAWWRRLWEKLLSPFPNKNAR